MIERSLMSAVQKGYRDRWFKRIYFPALRRVPLNRPIKKNFDLELDSSRSAERPESENFSNRSRFRNKTNVGNYQNRSRRHKDGKLEEWIDRKFTKLATCESFPRLSRHEDNLRPLIASAIQGLRIRDPIRNGGCASQLKRRRPSRRGARARATWPASGPRFERIASPST